MTENDAPPENGIPPKKPKRGRWFVVAVIVAVIVVGSLGSSEQKATDPAPITDAPTTTAGLSVRVDAWAEATSPVIDLLIEAFTNIEDAATTGNRAGLVRYCEDLSEIVADAEVATIPVPIEGIEGPWTAALESYASGAELCVSGARTLNSTLIAASTEAFIRGADYQKRVTAGLREYNEE